MWRLLIETVNGLRAIHALGVVHRDIKSANIYLIKPRVHFDVKIGGESVNSSEISQGTFLYQAKIGDMNVSKVHRVGMNLTKAGTPFYAAPEVFEDQYSAKSDIWALGIVIYEMLALKLPFAGTDLKMLQKKIQKNKLQRIPSHFSNDIWSIIQMMLQTDP